ncbi:hypothetical protein [Aeromicrobium sp. NPDC092404]|uniref:hypothetical protein n=1 Tax=Aeromicrobium sp. NPDC092404 TaxID=3154976 RepID=UPI0034124884
MIQLILVLVLVIALGTMVVQLARTLRGDGYGVRPPPRSHREEIDLSSPYRSLM